MAVWKRFVNNDKVKVTLYNELASWDRSVGVWLMCAPESDEHLILEVHGFGYALELVVE